MEMYNDMKKAVLLLAMLIGLFAILSGCKNDAAETQHPESIGETTESEEKQTETARNDDVILRVYGTWNDEENIRNQDSEYILSGEDAEMITGLFRSHEKKVLDSPMSNIATLQFEIGEDYLCTSVAAIEVLSGRIGGELVAVPLNEDECEAVHRIIDQFAQDVP